MFYRNIRKHSAYENTVLTVEMDRLKRIYLSEVEESSSWKWQDISNNQINYSKRILRQNGFYFRQSCGTTSVHDRSRSGVAQPTVRMFRDDQLHSHHIQGGRIEFDAKYGRDCGWHYSVGRLIFLDAISRKSRTKSESIIAIKKRLGLNIISILYVF